jgi:HD-GYP domain-containing protein (c-di-GMP phosphodiesterase class II)
VSYLLLHPESWSAAVIAPALEAAQVEARGIWDARDLVRDQKRPTVFVLDAEHRDAFPLEAVRRFVDAGGAVVALGREGEDDVPEDLPPELLSGFVPCPVQPRQLLVAIRAGYRETAARAEMERRRREVQDRVQEIDELTRIGMMLGTERDPEALLEEILKQARRLTQSDAGSLYLIKTKRDIRIEEEAAKGNLTAAETVNEDDDEKVLLFRLAQTESLPGIPFKQQKLPLDRTSLAGFTAVTGEALNIQDVYCLPPDVEYKFQRSFDDRFGYRTKSVLVVPMKDHQDEMIGVLQLINRKRNPTAKLATPADGEREVIRYSKRTQDLVTALAGQAAVSIENSNLYQEIERLFRGFIEASVYAIEKRDPVTRGHSKRVATLTVGLAETVSEVGSGPFRSVRFDREQIRQLHYAGLLHDFGKIGVHEDVLNKRKKLKDGGLELIQERHGFVVRTAERDLWRRLAIRLQKHGRKGFDAFKRKVKTEYKLTVADLNGLLKAVEQANEPTILPEAVSDEIAAMATRIYTDVSGTARPMLTEDEVRFLQIAKGTLDPAEREEIESHVTKTFEFLKKIPWTRELSPISNIAYGHHELLDGSGYPRKLSGLEIPIEVRMMTISDIYDALTAPDRPYKRRQPTERALDIMANEFVKVGKMDEKLFRLFVDAQVFRKTSDSAP